MKKIKKFFSEVRKELKKVKWPTKKDLVKYSIATICFVISTLIRTFAPSIVRNYEDRYHTTA